MFACQLAARRAVSEYTFVENLEYSLLTGLPPCAFYSREVSEKMGGEVTAFVTLYPALINRKRIGSGQHARSLFVRVDLM